MAEQEPRVAACWATLLTHANYVPCLAVLVDSMRACETQYPLVVMVTDTVDAQTRQVLEKMGCRIRDVEMWRVEHATSTMAYERFKFVWTKLRAFELFEYERVIMIDSDMLMCRNMDELFDMALPDGGIAAGFACTCNPKRVASYPASWTPANCGYTLGPHPPPPAKLSKPTHHLLNSGIVVLTPTSSQAAAIHTYMREHAERVSHYRFPDQDLLADVYYGRVRFLPWYYNALKTLRTCHADLWDDAQVRNIHYILEYVSSPHYSHSKPWHTGPAPDPDFSYLHTMWWRAYRALSTRHDRIGLSPADWTHAVAAHVRDPGYTNLL